MPLVVRLPLKALALSVGLFLVWGPMPAAYGKLIATELRLATGYEYFLQEEWLHRNSLFLIPLISLVLATPGVTWRRKAAGIGAGLLLLAGLDGLRIGLGIGDTGPSALYAVYHSTKIVVPLLAWLFSALPAIEAGHREEAAPDGRPAHSPCNDADQEHLTASQREVHGSPALRFGKIRKLLARHPQSAP